MLPKLSKKTVRLQSGHKTRAEHLQTIRAIAKAKGYAQAQLYWLQYCPRISTTAFQAAAN